jgi:transposase
MAEPLTERQREIKDRLDQGMTARDIGVDLGVSRNAVYQQIQRMRRRGNLDAFYTPSGQPPREPGAIEDVHRRIESTRYEPDDNKDVEQAAGMAALILQIRRTRDELDAISRRLSFIVPR